MDMINIYTPFLNEYDDYHIPMCYNAYLSI